MSCESEFAKGKKEGLQGGRGLLTEMAEGIAEIFPATKEYQSYRAGWKEGEKERLHSWSSSPKSGGSSSDESSDSYSYTSCSSCDDGSSKSMPATGCSWLPCAMFWVGLVVVFYLVVWTFSALEYGVSPFPLPWVPWLRDLLKH